LTRLGKYCSVLPLIKVIKIMDIKEVVLRGIIIFAFIGLIAAVRK
jgi:hypothetical protein